MKLIKIKEDHYVVVDDSEIKEGDLSHCSYTNNINKYSGFEKKECCKKITHSTQPLEEFIDNEGIRRIGWTNIKVLELSEVKELIGEVDVEKKALAINPIELIQGWDKKKEYRENWISGYNQAIEDNKEKKYTEEDMRIAITQAFLSGVERLEDFERVQEMILDNIQPKTEWEVDFFDGKLGFKK